MKNKILQITKYIFLIINLLFFSLHLCADEFEISALKIEVDNKNKKIFAKGEVIAESIDGLTINAQEVIYDKENNTLEAMNSVLVKDEKSNAEIRGDNILLDKKNETITSFGKTFINFKDNFNITTSDIIFNRIDQLCRTLTLHCVLCFNSEPLGIGASFSHCGCPMTSKHAPLESGAFQRGVL